MAVTDWIANLFQSEQTRGLSGGTAQGVALDDANPYYNYRLRRHRAEGDLVADPGLLWYTSPYVKRRSGLGTHIGAEKGDGVATFTDVLLVLSLEDYSRAVNVAQEPWLQTATRVLLQEFEDFCRRESFSRLYNHRQLGFRILCDGSADMGGQALGLQAGEFVTGLLPNLYTGPVRGSFPVIGVHVNMPSVWEGYQEVGRLYNDQILFTLGSHWLDNFSHPNLREAALYRLQQYPDGSFVHIINPDLQDRYQVTSTDQGGASVLTLATRQGEPLAYIVLAVVDPPTTPVGVPRDQAPGRPGISVPSAPYNPATIPPPMLIDDQVQPVPSSPSMPPGRHGVSLLGSKTIIPDAPSERIFTLQERGALLQKVHFANFMQGYQVYLGTRGELGTVVEEKSATFQVRKRQVSLVAHMEGVQVGGHPVAPGVEIPIEGDVVIHAGGQRLEYRDLRGLRVDGWPYVGEIRRPASSNYMIWGDTYKVGRSRECRVVLPDEPRNDNIMWKPSIGDGATIRARTGDIPKSRFYTDSIMVASEHSAVDLRGDTAKVVCQARHCYTYIRRNGEVFPLYPTTSGRQPMDLELEPGDEVLIGNCLFHVGFTPTDEAVAPAPAPKIEISSDQLVDAVSSPDFDKLEAPSDPGEAPPPPVATRASEGRSRRRERPRPDESPAAYGLGESGIAPQPVPIESVGLDSILGVAPPDDDADAEVNPPPLDESLDSLADLDAADEDHPTVPGAAIPREVLEAIEDGKHPDSVDLYGDDADRAASAAAGIQVEWDEDSWTGPPPPPPGAKDPGLETWDDAEEDSGYWDEPSAPPPPPDASVEPSGDQNLSVPPPFPEVEEPPPPPPPPAPAPVGADDAESVPTEGVYWVDDADAQFELGRPMHIVQMGWMVKGTAVCGNHHGADLVIPENRIDPEQTFEVCDYFELKIRGRRGSLTVLTPTELLINEADAEEGTYEDIDDILIEVIRRDDRGEEDFAVAMTIVQDRALPDPRSRFLRIDYEDDLAGAMLTRGLPKRTPRELTLGPIRMTATYDGDAVTVTDYLDSYRSEDGFEPFFVQKGDSRFHTAPEDGAPIVVQAGDRLVIGTGVYILREG